MKGYYELVAKMDKETMTQEEFLEEVKKVQAMNQYQPPEFIWQLLREDGHIQ